MENIFGSEMLLADNQEEFIFLAEMDQIMRELGTFYETQNNLDVVLGVITNHGYTEALQDLLGKELAVFGITKEMSKEDVLSTLAGSNEGIVDTLKKIIKTLFDRFFLFLRNVFGSFKKDAETLTKLMETFPSEDDFDAEAFAKAQIPGPADPAKLFTIRDHLYTIYNALGEVWDEALNKDENPAFNAAVIKTFNDYMTEANMGIEMILIPGDRVSVKLKVTDKSDNRWFVDTSKMTYGKIEAYVKNAIDEALNVDGVITKDTKYWQAALNKSASRTDGTTETQRTVQGAASFMLGLIRVRSKLSNQIIRTALVMAKAVATKKK